VRKAEEERGDLAPFVATIRTVQPSSCQGNANKLEVRMNFPDLTSSQRLRYDKTLLGSATSGHSPMIG